MTNEQRKEQLRNEFDVKFCYLTNEFNFKSGITPADVWDWFYSEIEARDRRFEDLLSLWNPVDEYVRPLTSLGFSVSAKALELVKRVERLEEIINAADEVIQRGYSPGSVDTSGFGENDKYYEALEHYNKLKSKLPSGI